jgi:hypothetical protein
MTIGFQLHRDRTYWTRAIKLLAAHASPEGVPKYGYMLESNGAPVGVLLLIFSARPSGTALNLRCNVSSWYVRPEFRSFAALLASHATRRKDVIYLNITASPHTWPILEAQGYRCFSEGLYIVSSILGRFSPKLKIDAATPEVCRDADLLQYETELLLRHADFGCVSVVGTSEGRQYPFVFGLRHKYGVPLAHLVYCRDRADFVQFAGPLSRFLLARGYPLVVLDANGPVRGLAGRYLKIRPKFSKGPAPLRIGDLAYTERVMFGF